MKNYLVLYKNKVYKLKKFWLVDFNIAQFYFIEFCYGEERWHTFDCNYKYINTWCVRSINSTEISNMIEYNSFSGYKYIKFICKLEKI